MSRQQTKFMKKKNREREVRKKILARREAMRRQRKEEAAKEDQYEKEYTGGAKPAPIVKKLDKDDDIKRRLEHNIEVLRALEQEYLAEMEQRKQLNEKLEAEGSQTIKEKLDFLQARAIDILNEKGVEGVPTREEIEKLRSADCRVVTAT